MEWIGWVVAVVAVSVAVWVWRLLVAERAHGAQLLYARIDAENQANTLRENQDRVVQAARSVALGGVLDDAVRQLRQPLESAHADLETAKHDYADYRELVKRYDAAVQYCLQPVELIFGADKASLDQLVHHVEGARRKLFEARSALEKNPAHAGSDLLKKAAAGLQPLARLTRALDGLTVHAGASAAVDVNACLDDVLCVLAPRFGARITIVRDYSDLPPLRGAPRHLHELFLYLLDNAARSIESKGTVTLATRDGGNDTIEVAITDTGTGITDEVMENIREPFFTTHADQGAIGLGLTYAQALVDAQGGSIAIRTIRGHGTTFTIGLPILARPMRNEESTVPVPPTSGRAVQTH